jgi:hypothetical protein
VTVDTVDKLVNPMNQGLRVKMNAVARQPVPGVLNHVVVLAHALPVSPPVVPADLLFNEVGRDIFNVGNKLLN